MSDRQILFQAPVPVVLLPVSSPSLRRCCAALAVSYAAQCWDVENPLRRRDGERSRAREDERREKNLRISLCDTLDVPDLW